jgi:hemerythrin superfamily protein
MDIDNTAHRSHDTFPVDNPMEALKTDHEFVKKLFDRYLNTQDINVKRQAGPQILLALEMHTALEEAVFYPRVHDIDPALVDHSEEEHQQVKDMIAKLKGMDEADPQCDQLFQQLQEAVMHHVESEEQKLFPEVQRATFDLTELGLQMQAFEANMVSAQATESARGARR